MSAWGFRLPCTNQEHNPFYRNVYYFTPSLRKPGSVKLSTFEAQYRPRCDLSAEPWHWPCWSVGLEPLACVWWPVTADGCIHWTQGNYSHEKQEQFNYSFNLNSSTRYNFIIPRFVDVLPHFEFKMTIKMFKKALTLKSSVETPNLSTTVPVTEVVSL
jgi:hypothetical protein